MIQAVRGLTGRDQEGTCKGNSVAGTQVRLGKRTESPWRKFGGGGGGVGEWKIS